MASLNRVQSQYETKCSQLIWTGNKAFCYIVNMQVMAGVQETDYIDFCDYVTTPPPKKKELQTKQQWKPILKN